VKWNAPEISWLEGIFSRGDRRLLNALISAWNKGARYDAWGDQFNREIWREALSETGIDEAVYLDRERDLDEMLPWEHVRSGVDKRYLQMEWKKALEGRTTSDCRLTCHECGVCDHRVVDPVIHTHWNRPPAPEILPRLTAHPYQRTLRIRFSKTGTARFLGHLELTRLFTRALRRTGVEMVHSQGFHPMPKLSFSTALAVGTESLDETAYIDIQGNPSTGDFQTHLNRQLPDGIRITGVEDITGSRKKNRLVESHYRITVPFPVEDPTAVSAFLMEAEVPVSKSTKKGRTVTFDLRKRVKCMEWKETGLLHLEILHWDGPELKASEIVSKVLGLDKKQSNTLSVLKMKQVLK
jgi:radical SAM-linked protein